MASWLANFLLRLRALVFRNRFDAALDDEFQFHLEMRERYYRDQGLDAEAARSASRRRTGNLTSFKETTREMRTFTRVEALFRDLLLAVRTLRRDPGFSLLAVLILALGIGVNIASFSVLDAILIRMLPVRDPASLFRLARARASADDNAGGACSLALFQQMKTRTYRLADLMAYNLAERQTVTLHRGQELQLYHQIVSGNYFQVLGVGASFGRPITPADDTYSLPVAMISSRLWKESFGESAAAIGSRLTINDQSFEIVGVAPSAFFGVEIGKVVDVWTPVASAPPENLRNDHAFWLHPMGRLAPGITVAQAAAPMAGVVDEFMREDARQHAPAGTPPSVIKRFLDDMEVKGVPAGGGVASLRKEYSTALRAVMALAVIVLLICCTNLANLILARGAGRRQEFALRLSLGAGRLRILQQLVIENFVLAIASTALGALFSHWATPFFIGMLRPSGEAVELSIHLDMRLLLIAVLLTIPTVMISGLLPIGRLLGSDLAGLLRSRAGASRKKGRQQRFLVVTQIALSFVLAAGALLFTGTLGNLLSTPLGFSPAGILISRLSLPRAGDEANSFPAAWNQLLARLQGEPDIKDASLSSATMFDGDPPYIGLRTDAIQPAPLPPTAAILFVSASYFRTLGISLSSGRLLEERDFQPGAPPAVLVNQAFAAKFYGSQDPLRHRLTRIADAPNWSEIVGVVGNVRVSKLRGSAPPILYVPYTSMTAWLRPDTHPGYAMTLQIRRGPEAVAFLPELRRLAGSQFKVPAVVEQQKYIDDTLVRERLLSRVADLFGIVCLLLAAIGLYSVTSYSVLQRRRDIGIRVALGANPRTILISVIAEAGRMIVIGIFAGAAIAASASRAARSLLFGLTPGGPATYIAAALLLLVTMYFAALIPAWRASATDPMTVLRNE